MTLRKGDGKRGRVTAIQGGNGRAVFNIEANGASSLTFAHLPHKTRAQRGAPPYHKRKEKFGIGIGRQETKFQSSHPTVGRCVVTYGSRSASVARMLTPTFRAFVHASYATTARVVSPTTVAPPRAVGIVASYLRVDAPAARYRRFDDLVLDDLVLEDLRTHEPSELVSAAAMTIRGVRRTMPQPSVSAR